MPWETVFEGIMWSWVEHDFRAVAHRAKPEQALSVSLVIERGGSIAAVSTDNIKSLGSAEAWVRTLTERKTTYKPEWILPDLQQAK